MPGLRQHLVGAGVEVLEPAAGDRVGALDGLVVTDQPDPLVALVEHDPASFARVLRRGRIGYRSNNGDRRLGRRHGGRLHR
ncbi:hypothetical protein [Aeromicrobium sp. UC242_57]|uniref:hypothetical protein n=1 Tax=Aeromicrobium sp. UC242_57 TaxID=3374624 RepID=UPI0037BF080A